MRAESVAPNEFVERLERVSQAMSWDEIGDLTDPVERNYLITHNYWCLADQMAALLGRDNLVWPGFGAWASEQAGSYMRHEGLPLLDVVPFVGDRITELLGRGNRLIFLDIAPVFDRFIALMSIDDKDVRAEHKSLASSGRAHLPAYIEEALGLDPRLISQSDDGQRAMIWAFSQYFLAAHADSPESRAEHIYLANCFVGLQEQSRVDCMLDALLQVDGVNRVALWLSLPVVRLWATAVDLQNELRRRLEIRRQDESIGRPCRMWRACLVEGRLTEVLGTQLLMELEFDDEAVELGEDVPWCSTTSMFPAHLARLDEASPDFRAHVDQLHRWDRTPDTTEGSAALDWSDLADRMNFIVDLFRTRQQDARLRAHPLADYSNTAKTI